MKQCMFFLAVLWMTSMEAKDVNVTIRRAPYDVPSVSTRSDRGSTSCKYCNTTIRYDRKYKWDVANHNWVETTDPASIPQVCKKCREAEKAQKGLDKQERRLDRDIKYQQTKGRVEKKSEKLKRLRQTNR